MVLILYNKVLNCFILLFFLMSCEVSGISDLIEEFDNKECILKLNSFGEIYKFNLASEENEFQSEIEVDEYRPNLIIIVNICKSFNYKLCTSTICLFNKTSENVTDIGRELTSGIFKNKVLKLTFTGLDKCNSTLNYSTTIVFGCNEDPSDPSVLRWDKFENCNFKLVWISTIGCPVEEVSVNNSCIINTPSKSFDLRPLKNHLGYKVGNDSSGNYRRIYFNFCEYLPSSVCGPKAYLCGSHRNQSNDVISREFTITVKNSNDISIIFHKLNGPGKIIFSINCENGLMEPTLKFASVQGTNDYFILSTTIVCESLGAKCQKRDNKGKTYDLSELQKFTGNWKVADKNGDEIIFNICASLNYEPNISCSGGNIFACLKTSKNKIFSIGTHQGPIIILNEGHITFNYSGGGICKEKELFTLKVSLLCGNTNSTPSLVKISECSYLIRWYTTAGCPLEYIKGTGCSVNGISVKSLFMGPKYLIINKASDTFFISLCQPLSVDCSTKEKNVSICWIDNKGKRYAIGHYGYPPVYSLNRVKFIMQGMPCNVNESKSIVILELRCDYRGGDAKPVFINKTDNCVFNFIWYTNLVCPKLNSNSITECSKVNDSFNNTYDLSSLVRFRDNYKINNGSDTYYINICNPVVPGPQVRCDTSFYGVCLVKDNSANIKYLGLVPSKLEIDKNTSSLQLIYPTGDICTDGSKPTYSAVMTFYCHLNSETYPKFLNYDDCTYNFEWFTPLACPRKEPPGVITNNICTAENPFNNYRFDLTSLMKDNWIVDSSLTISICRPLELANCPSNSGSCLHAQGSYINMGNANGNLQYKNGLLYLNYTAGVDCRSTIIYFTCNSENLSLSPVIVEDIDHCITVIHWATPLACQNSLGKVCNDTYDRSPWHLLRDVFAVDVGNETVFLNSCKVPKKQLTLSCNTALQCIGSTITYSNTFINDRQERIGSSVFSSPTFEIREVFGEICSGQISKTYTTSLKLHCDHKASDEQPKFLNLAEDCTYNFEWRNNLFCYEAAVYNCTSIENTDGHRIISAFQNFHTNTIKSKQTGITYSFNFCDKHKRCASDICIIAENGEELSFAHIHHISSVKKYSPLTFHYNLVNNNCTGLSSAEISLICNSNEKGEPIIISESLCNLEIEWESKYACIDKLAESSDLKITTSSITFGIIFGSLISVIIILAIIFMIWKNWYNLRYFVLRRSKYSRYPLCSTEDNNVIKYKVNFNDEDDEEEDLIVFKQQ